jgi:arabinan endo-1,5-alpha-L-arabinosidase
MVVRTDTSGVKNSIDQFYFKTKGETYLFWGSFGGIYGQRISSDMKTLLGEKFKIAGSDIEGSYLYEYAGKYWYLSSAGTCCNGKRSTYHLTVAVSDNVRGPYLRKDGSSILIGTGEATTILHADHTTGWVGPGHCGEIISDDDGRYFILYHAVYYERDNGRPLLMDEIIWDDGWPRIAENVPSHSAKRAPFFLPKK